MDADWKIDQGHHDNDDGCPIIPSNLRERIQDEMIKQHVHANVFDVGKYN